MTTNRTNAGFGVSGLSTFNNIKNAAVGVAGLDWSGMNSAVSAQTAVISDDSGRLGDVAAANAWRSALWFADFSYIVSPNKTTGMEWRARREKYFDKATRRLPVFIDSCGYRREIVKTAPSWAYEFEVYQQVIDFISPDGYASWDYPYDRQKSMMALHELDQIYPNDGRMWPVFSVIWSWDDNAHLDYAHLPAWAGENMARLIPVTRTQRPFKTATLETWARQAVANALKLANDKDFKFMCDKWGKVMLGGMVRGPIPRQARHLFVAVLCHLFPDVKFWLLGQANFAVINGLGAMGLLDRVYTDGTWWIHDSRCHRFAVVENGLITMMELGTRNGVRQNFFTLNEMMAANLRSIMSAYQGLWTWPDPAPLPTNLNDLDQLYDMKGRLTYNQMVLGL